MIDVLRIMDLMVGTDPTGVAGAVDRLMVKLARVVVPPYMRERKGHIESVEGYTYNRRSSGAVQKVEKALQPRSGVNRMTVTHPLSGYGITYFDSKTCPRCGGTGEFSFNQMHGSMCYQCSGHARVLTKKGAEGYDEYAALMDKQRYPAPSDLKTGDLVTWPPGEKPQKWATVVGTEKQVNGYVKVTVTQGGEEKSSLIPDNPQKPFMGGAGFRRRTTMADLPDKSTFPGYVGFQPQGWHLGKWYDAPEVVAANVKKQDAAKAAAEARKAQLQAEKDAAAFSPKPQPPVPEDFRVLLDGSQGTHIALGSKVYTQVDLGGSKFWVASDRKDWLPASVQEGVDEGLRQHREVGQPSAMESMLPAMRKGKLGDEVLSAPGLIEAGMLALALQGGSARWSDFISSMQEARYRNGTLTPKQARGVLNTLRKQVVKEMDALAPITAPAVS